MSLSLTHATRLIAAMVELLGWGREHAGSNLGGHRRWVLNRRRRLQSVGGSGSGRTSRRDRPNGLGRSQPGWRGCPDGPIDGGGPRLQGGRSRISGRILGKAASRSAALAGLALTLAFASTPALAQSGLILCADPRVTDGDTLRCDGLKIRLWGIDAPEHDTEAGPAATNALRDLVTDETLVCRSRGKSYDRAVAQCWIGNRDVAGEMVRQHQAVDWPKFSHGYYRRFSLGERR